jgi:hypothetical protein
LPGTLLHPLRGRNSAGVPPAEAGRGDGPPVSLERPHIPLQQRLTELQKATGMTRAELAEAVRDWVSATDGRGGPSRAVPAGEVVARRGQGGGQVAGGGEGDLGVGKKKAAGSRQYG